MQQTLVECLYFASLLRFEKEQQPIAYAHLEIQLQSNRPLRNQILGEHSNCWPNTSQRILKTIIDIM